VNCASASASSSKPDHFRSIVGEHKGECQGLALSLFMTGQALEQETLLLRQLRRPLPAHDADPAHRADRQLMTGRLALPRLFCLKRFLMLGSLGLGAVAPIGEL